MKHPKLIVSLILLLPLIGCIGSVIGVAVDTAAIEAPFQIAGAVVGVAAGTTDMVIVVPIRMANAAVEGGHHDRHHGHDHSEQDTEHSERQSTYLGICTRAACR